MIGWFVFVVDVFWWAVLNGIILYCFYTVFIKFNNNTDEPSPNFFELVRSIIPKAKAKPKSHPSSEPKPKTNLTTDLKRKHK